MLQIANRYVISFVRSLKLKSRCQKMKVAVAHSLVWTPVACICIKSITLRINRIRQPKNCCGMVFQTWTKAQVTCWGFWDGFGMSFQPPVHFIPIWVIAVSDMMCGIQLKKRLCKPVDKHQVSCNHISIIVLTVLTQNFMTFCISSSMCECSVASFHLKVANLQGKNIGVGFDFDMCCFFACKFWTFLYSMVC